MKWTSHDISRTYPKILATLYMDGEEVSPRGMGTREILGTQIEIPSTARTMPTGINRKLNPAIGVAEALQLIAGQQYPNLMCRIGSKFKHFLNGEAFHGSYGERLAAQIPQVLERLSCDEGSRQAVAMIWDPVRDLFIDDRQDLPCTTQMQWLVRDTELHQVVTMRSSDIWWGIPYDLFQFTQLNINMADVLCLTPGQTILNSGSLHLYEKNYKDAYLVSTIPDDPIREPIYSGPIANRPEGPQGLRSWEGTQVLARLILEQPHKIVGSEFSITARWMAETLLKGFANHEAKASA